MRAQGKGSSPGRVEGSSRAMLATARRSCILSTLSGVHKALSVAARDELAAAAGLICVKFDT